MPGGGSRASRAREVRFQTAISRKRLDMVHFFDKIGYTLSIGIGFRVLAQRISEIAGHGRNLDHEQRKRLEMMGVRIKGLLTRFQIPRCRNEHNSCRTVGQYSVLT